MELKMAYPTEADLEVLKKLGLLNPTNKKTKKNEEQE
jgi:hypothetical protein